MDKLKVLLNDSLTPLYKITLSDCKVLSGSDVKRLKSIIDTLEKMKGAGAS